MAASFKKLKIDEQHLTGAQVVAYLADPQSAGDYYTESGTAPMNWLATPLANTVYALGENVSRTKLRLLIEGRDPVSGRGIRHRGGDRTMVGAQDVTLSPAPKSVSILWALGDDRLRFELEVLVGTANDIAINRMLREQPLVRQRYGPGSKDIRRVVAKDYVGVQVMHTTARMTANDLKVPDPQLHVHNVLIGAVAANGELRAIDSEVILDYIAALEAEATGYLAAKLRERGYEIEWRLEYRGNGQPRMAWEVKGVPSSLVKAMSRRSAEIEDLKEQYSKATGRAALGPGWDAFVVSRRRPEAEDHGFDLADVDALVAAADRRRAEGVGKVDESSPEAAELRRLVLEHLCKHHAFVPVAELERLAWQLAVGRVDPRTAGRVVAHIVGDGDLVVMTDDQVTTLEVLAYEQPTRRAAEELLMAPLESPVAEELVVHGNGRAEGGRLLPGDQAPGASTASSSSRTSRGWLRKSRMTCT